MIVYNHPQGSPEWKLARAGRITASKFHLVRASARLKSGANKGDYSSAAHDYAFRTAIERISGDPLDEGFEVWSAARGHELEPAARAAHEVKVGVIVEPAGFVTTPDGVFGASQDGWIDDDGSAEYKCFLDPQKLRDILLSDDWTGMRDQAQGGLWITGRKWIDICLYCPALESIGRELTWKRFLRDENYIEELEADLLQFKVLVDRYEHRLRRNSATPEQRQAAQQTIAVGGDVPNIF